MTKLKLNNYYRGNHIGAGHILILKYIADGEMLVYDSNISKNAKGKTITTKNLINDDWILSPITKEELFLELL